MPLRTVMLNKKRTQLQAQLIVLSDPTKGWAGNANTSYAGESASHNNMPPYLAVYMWRRTA